MFCSFLSGKDSESLRLGKHALRFTFYVFTCYAYYAYYAHKAHYAHLSGVPIIVTGLELRAKKKGICHRHPIQINLKSNTMKNTVQRYEPFAYHNENGTKIAPLLTIFNRKRIQRTLFASLHALSSVINHHEPLLHQGFDATVLDRVAEHAEILAVRLIAEHVLEVDQCVGYRCAQCGRPFAVLQCHGVVDLLL